MKSLTGKSSLFFALLLMFTCLAGVWRWYSRYSRFPAHSLPFWSVFEAFRIERTKNDLAAATKALEGFHEHYQKLPFNRPDREDQFSITLGHELNGVSPGTNRQNTDAIVFWSLPAGEQRDGWGRLYHFYFDHDGDGFVHPGGMAVKRSFVIWSDGTNGRDEFGTADDLRSWQVQFAVPINPEQK